MLQKLVNLYMNIIHNNTNLENMLNSCFLTKHSCDEADKESEELAYIINLFNNSNFSWNMMKMNKNENKLYKQYLRQSSILDAIRIYQYNLCREEEKLILYRTIIKNKEHSLLAFIYHFQFKSEKDKKDYITYALINASNIQQALRYYYYQLSEDHISYILDKTRFFSFNQLQDLLIDYSIPIDFRIRLFNKVSHTFSLSQYKHLFIQFVDKSYNEIRNYVFNYLIKSNISFNFFSKYIDNLQLIELEQVYMKFYNNISNSNRDLFVHYCHRCAQFLTNQHKDKLITLLGKYYNQYSINYITANIQFTDEQQIRLNAIECLDNLRS